MFDCTTASVAAGSLKTFASWMWKERRGPKAKVVGVKSRTEAMGEVALGDGRADRDIGIDPNCSRIDETSQAEGKGQQRQPSHSLPWRITRQPQRTRFTDQLTGTRTRVKVAG